MPAHLQVRHRDTIFHVVLGLLDGLEEVSESLKVDARLCVHAQHGVGLPSTCGRVGLKCAVQ